jgi:hypothetical protein
MKNVAEEWGQRNRRRQEGMRVEARKLEGFGPPSRPHGSQGIAVGFIPPPPTEA